MSHPLHHTTKVAIIGAGNVGASFAYALLQSGLANEIVLIDANQAKAEGEAMDLNHAVPLLRPCRVWAGSLEDCRDAIVTVVTAGSAQRPGETRLDLVQRNVAIFRTLIPTIASANPHGIILVATNPVDVLTYAALKLSGLPENQVLGSGTILDTARFRHLLSQQFGVDARSVHAYIIGEHGDSEVPVWSLANIAGMKIAAFCEENHIGCTPVLLDDIFAQTRDAAYEIIQRKGATYYAIGAGLLRIVEAILRDQSTVLSVSSLMKDFPGVGDVCFSLPTIVDRGGVEKVIHLDLDENEKQGLLRSARILRGIIDQIGL